ncbi:LytR/AlgR family response regulator transcription factor [Sphingomonas glaciei]|uniref:Response regulator n=1 Tax=Sphingomonas glaciei TaxID=2938948 RepID=A0ABY5MS84_9SPHN|nr:response regulator [Sphingomonas glaciei]UUR06786.1 response regulator [Sphingomonas glaciei]
MLKILIVEDERPLAETLRYLVEDNPRYRVVGIAEDLPSALELLEHGQPDLALVDLHLARGSTGFSVAVRLNDAGVPCLFVTGRPPGFAMPDLALGILLKPFTGNDVHRALALAEDVMRGRETLRPRLPRNLQLFEPDEEPEPLPVSAALPERQGLKARLERWISGAAH